jgi:hypothetical protein
MNDLSILPLAELADGDDTKMLRSVFRRLIYQNKKTGPSLPPSIAE